MRNIKLTLEYDGGKYSGWQRQKNAITIQQIIEDGIFKITGENVVTNGCSRTDAGVHAREFICNFYTESNIQDSKFRDAINAKIPKDIRVIDSCEVEETFHSRYHCKGKTYSYTIINRDVAPAIFRSYMYHVRAPIDIERMEEAAKYLEGTHDFKAFRNEGSSVKTTVRTIKAFEFEKLGQCIKIYATADGFLYNMMRIMCGTLVDIGIGRRQVKDMEEILEGKDRKKAAKAVPAHGLCLEKVFY